LKAKHLYEFGQFRLDPGERRLLCDETPVALTPKCFDLLTALVENSGHLLEKEALLQRIWPNQFVEESNLSFNISTLRKALGDGQNGQRYIETVPKKGFRFVAPVTVHKETNGPLVEDETNSAATNAGTTSTSTLPSSRLNGRSFKLMAFVAFSLAAVLMGVLLLKSKSDLAPLRVVPFTSYEGRETQPAFSPDGNYLAFVWRGQSGDNLDVYMKPVDGGTPLRLTSDPAKDSSPAWSPDGRHVAFLRRSKEANSIYEITVPAGPERKMADFRLGPSFLDGRRLDWSPDGKTLAVAERVRSSNQHAIFLVSVETGEERQLTTPGAEDTGDVEPAVSPDGHAVAFIRETHYLVREIFLIPFTGGETKRVTFDNKKVLGIAWTGDGSEIVFSSDPNGSYTLRRIPAAGGVSVPVAGTSGFSTGWGNHISELTIARRGNRLAYTQWLQDVNTYRVEVPTSSAQSVTPQPFNASTQWESSAQYSPDGKSIAFASDRSGNLEILVCASDGSNTFQLTNLGEPETGSPHWSPDGNYIVFDSRHGGNADIFVIKASGGQPRRLTTESSEDNTPFWSPDGRWIYFSSKRTGDWQVWKVSPEGDGAVQVTRQVGFGPVPSPDGKFIYFAKGPDMNVGLWRIAADGSNEERVPGFDRNTWWCFAVTDSGIFFEDTSSTQNPTVVFFDFKTRQYKTIVTLQKSLAASMGVSPDGRSVFYSVFDRDDSDIMMAENFR